MFITEQIKLLTATIEELNALNKQYLDGCTTKKDAQIKAALTLAELCVEINSTVYNYFK